MSEMNRGSSIFPWVRLSSCLKHDACMSLLPAHRASWMWRAGGGAICSRSAGAQLDLQPRGWRALTGSSDTVSPSDCTADIKAIYRAAIQHIQYISIQNWFNKMTEECVRPCRRPAPQNGHILILFVLSMALWRRCFASIWLLWSD